MTPEMMENMSRLMGNLDLFARHLIPQVSTYMPDVDALRASSTRIVLGVGESSTEQQLPYRTTYALAERLGVTPVAFPGEHGFGDPAAFAAVLNDVLAGAERLVLGHTGPA
jgi:hypothetical protein